MASEITTTLTELKKEWEGRLLSGYKPGDTPDEGIMGCPIIDGVRVKVSGKYVDTEYLFLGRWLYKAEALAVVRAFLLGHERGVSQRGISAGLSIDEVENVIRDAEEIREGEFDGLEDTLPSSEGKEDGE